MSKKENSTGKKKFPVGMVVLVILVLLLVNAGVFGFLLADGAHTLYNPNKVKGISVEGEVFHEYEKVDTSKVMLDMGMSKKQSLQDYKGTYTLSSPCYSSKTFTVFLDGDNDFSCDLDNFVKAQSVVWYYNDGSKVPYLMSPGVVQNPEEFNCIIEYENGDVIKSNAEFVQMEQWRGDTAEFLIYMGGATFRVQFSSDREVPVEEEVEALDETGSGEDMDETLEGIDGESEGESEAGSEGTEGDSEEDAGADISEEGDGTAEDGEDLAEPGTSEAETKTDSETEGLDGSDDEAVG